MQHAGLNDGARARALAVLVAVLISVLMSVFVLTAVRGVAWATVEEGDQSQPTAEEIAAAIASGYIASPDDGPTGDEMTAQSASNSKIESPYDIAEYSGATMYETSVAQALAAYPDGCESAVIAGPGAAWVDALAASGLAASKGPILFAEKDGMHKATLQALADLGVKSVIIVGGTAALGSGVEKDLEAAGISVEARLWGQNCFGTQMAIYDYGVKNDLWAGDMAIVSTAKWFGDALSVSPVAYARKAPIFLADGESLDLDADQKKAIEAAGFSTIVITGGTAVVSNDAQKWLDAQAKANGGACVRLGGAEQYETSAIIAEWSVTDCGFAWDNVAFTTGMQPYDALSGSVLQGITASPLLLADSPSKTAAKKAASHKGDITALRFFGGKRALTSDERFIIADQFGIPYAALPNFKLYLDAGHGPDGDGRGSFDSGALGNGYREYDLTKELANMVADILRDDYGMDVFVNDDGGWYKLRHAEAVNLGCDALVSIHFNAAGTTGTLSLIHEYAAAAMSAAWQQQIHPHLVKGLGLKDQGMITMEIAVVNGELPAVLLEICYIDNASDMSTYQSKKPEVARSIAEGIVE